MDELKCCPFCGADAMLIVHCLFSEPKYKYFTIGCSGNCQIEMGEFETKENAIAMWNKRKVEILKQTGDFV